MKNQYALAFARSPATILFQSENDNMWSDWEDFIVATRTKKGVFTVLARKLSDEFLDGKSKRKWFLIHSESHITKVDDFVNAVKACEQALNVDIYWTDVITALSKLDSEFAEKLEKFVAEL